VNEAETNTDAMDNPLSRPPWGRGGWQPHRPPGDRACNSHLAPEKIDAAKKIDGELEPSPPVETPS
jgi:hypothetical protein